MSDLFETRQKVEEGANWRGSITVNIGGEAQELSVRQLRDPEFWDVMSRVNTDELEALQDSLPEEKMEELEELQSADDLSDAEEERLATLQEEIEEQDIDLFTHISGETYRGLKKAAEYGTEPDQSDIQYALTEYAGEIRDRYGGSSAAEAREYVNDVIIPDMFDKSTNFTSFSVGVKVLTETVGETKN